MYWKGYQTVIWNISKEEQLVLEYRRDLAYKHRRQGTKQLLTHIGIMYDKISSKKGKKDTLNVLISEPNKSPTLNMKRN